MTTVNLDKNGGLDTFVHDGDARMTDENLEFGEVTWMEALDGVAMTLDRPFCIDCRISDATALSLVESSNPDATEEEVLSAPTPEGKDGKGVNKLAVSGTINWNLLLFQGPDSSEPQIYSIGIDHKSTLNVLLPEDQQPKGWLRSSGRNWFRATLTYSWSSSRGCRARIR